MLLTWKFLFVSIPDKADVTKQNSWPELSEAVKNTKIVGGYLLFSAILGGQLTISTILRGVCFNVVFIKL